MTIEKFIDNFSDKKRVSQDGETMTVTTQYKWYTDIIFLILFLSLLFPAIKSYLLNTGESITSIIFFIIFSISVIVYLTRGDNKLKIDLEKGTLTIRKRSPFLFFIPTNYLNFDTIIKYQIIERVTRSIIHYDLKADKKSGLFKQITLITFMGDERNNADLLLSFLKKTIVRQA